MRWPWGRAVDEDPQPDLRGLHDDHLRAGGLAARRLVEALGPIDAAWLDDHLATCPACAAIAAAYAADHGLFGPLRDRHPRPPRDLWARTAIALERERERGVRGRRASLTTREASQPPAGWPSPNRRQRVSLRLVSGLLVVALVAGAAVLDRVSPALFPTPSRGGGPIATPIPVSADVGWIQPGSNGGYDIYLTRVGQVCPVADPSACGPIQESARGSISLDARPQSVSWSPSASQLVVVSIGASSGAVYVVPVSAALAIPTASPSPGPTGSLDGTPTASPASTAPTQAPSDAAASGPISGGSDAPGASPTPSPAEPIAIAQGIIVVGGTAAYSPDGAWLAFAARPADGSTGPDIYAWRVGEALARPITTDHRSIFSGWLGDWILGSRIDALPLSASGAAASLRPTGGAPVEGIPASPEPSFSAPAGSPRPSGGSAASALPGASVPSSAPLSSLVPPLVPSRAPSPPASPIAGSDRAEPIPTSSTPAPSAPANQHGATAFLLDPATAEIHDLASVRFMRPVVDPTRRWVVYWDGTVTSDANGVDWRPGVGQIVVAPWTFGGGVGLIGSPAPSASPASSGAAPRGGAHGTGTASGTGTEPASGTSAAPGRPTASASGAVPSSADRSSSPGGQPASGPSSVPGASSARPSPSLDPTAPQALVDGPVVDFDAQFDPTGTHLAVWTASPADPSTGYISLFVLRDGAWALDPDHHLVAAPAVRGFSIGPGELAWVTPSDAGGKGSHIEVIGWTADGFGVRESAPGDSLVVIR